MGTQSFPVREELAEAFEEAYQERTRADPAEAIMKATRLSHAAASPPARSALQW